jgi:calcineurin-like phosphoesterase family protein
MTYWVTTDTHLGHEKIIDFCDRPIDFNERIIKGLYIMKPEDILIHLGDVAWNDAGEKRYLENIPCHKKWLVLGNHDKSANFHLKAGWDWTARQMSMRRFGLLIRFSHKPVPIGEEDIQLHGHFHNTDHHFWEEWLTAVMGSKHKLLVLENVDYKPVKLEDLLKEEIKRKQALAELSNPNNQRP